MGGVSNFLASIDPGPSIGNALASVDKSVTQPVGNAFAQADKFMTNLTPYGWALPAAIVAAYFTGGGSLAAEGAAEAGAAGAAEAGATTAATEAATTAGSEAFANGVASGMSEAEATAAANTAADASLASSAGVEPGAGLNALGNSGVGLNAGNASGIAATQSAAGLGGAGTGIIEGLAPTSVGMGGTAGAGSLAGIAGSEAAAGLGALGTGLTAEQLAAYEAANPGMSTSDIVNAANKARQLASALNPSGGTPTSQQLSQFKTATQPALTAATPLARANQSAFMGTTQEPTSIQNPLANTQNFLAQLAQEGTQAVPTNNLANLLRTA